MRTLIGTDPDQAPANQMLGELAYVNPEQLVLRPPASVTPQKAGALVIQLTNDTTLVIKVKGLDGVVRSTTLTLA